MRFWFATQADKVDSYASSWWVNCARGAARAGRTAESDEPLLSDSYAAAAAVEGAKSTCTAAAPRRAAPPDAKAFVAGLLQEMRGAQGGDVEAPGVAHPL